MLSLLIVLVVLDGVPVARAAVGLAVSAAVVAVTAGRSVAATSWLVAVDVSDGRAPGRQPLY
jgi:hypothetical protein